MANIESGKAIRYGWETLKKDFWYFIGVFVLYLVITGIPNGRGGDDNGWGILGLFVSAWLTGGLYRILLDYTAGNKQEMTVLFTQFSNFWKILGGTLLVMLIVVAGLILLIVPGFIWALKYQFTVYFIVDKNLGIRDAMRASAELTKGIKSQLFMFDLTCALVVILGLLCLGIGVFVAVPVVYLAMVHVYRILTATAVAPAVTTPQA